MNGFGKGLLVGLIATTAAVAGALFTVKKTMIEPVEVKEQELDENRKKAMRKSFARS